MQTDTKTIFMADNDETVVDATLMMLQLMGYSVRHTLDGAKVPALVQAKPDLLLLDILLPGIDSYAVCREFKNNPVTKNIPVLMVSAGGHVMETALASGADGFLAKPYEMNELIHKIDELINAA